MTGCNFGDISVAHGVNLALLQHFFSESQLSNIWGNSLLPDPGKIFLPDLKIFKAEYSHELEADKRVRFDLKRISNLTKHDVDAFGSLAHSMVEDWRHYRTKEYEKEFVISSWKYWALIASGLVAFCALILSLLLSYRVRILTATVTAMQLPVRVHSLPIELNFFTTTRMPSFNISAPFSFQLQYVPDTMSEIIIIILLTVSVLFTIMIWFRYRRHTNYKFDLYLYIGSNKHVCPIWVRSFALDPSSYTFLADSYIQNLRIQGCFLPQLKIDWSSLTIRSVVTNESYQLPRSFRLSWSQKRRLTGILQNPYWCVLVTTYKGHSTVVELPDRPWESAPAYEGQGHINEAISMEVLSPTTSGIYPKLPSAH